MKVYISGPYTEDPHLWTNRVVDAGIRLMRQGHQVHMPHPHTDRLHGLFSHERFMELDYSYIDWWADALLFLGGSKGADLELARARNAGLLIVHCDEFTKTDGSKSRELQPSERYIASIDEFPSKPPGKPMPFLRSLSDIAQECVEGPWTPLHHHQPVAIDLPYTAYRVIVSSQPVGEGDHHDPGDENHP